jgi:hypothetical protein
MGVNLKGGALHPRNSRASDRAGSVGGCWPPLSLSLAEHNKGATAMATRWELRKQCGELARGGDCQRARW